MWNKRILEQKTDQVEHYMKQLFEVEGPALLEISTDADKV